MHFLLDFTYEDNINPDWRSIIIPFCLKMTIMSMSSLWDIFVLGSWYLMTINKHGD